MKYLFILVLALVCITGCVDEEASLKLKIGDSAPVFSGVDLAGNPFRLGDFTGEPVILRFWDTNCKFCKVDTPVFNDLHEKFYDKGLHIAYINTLSNMVEVKRFINDLEIKFPVLMDDNSIIAHLYHVRVVPQTIVINRHHKIVAAISGGVSEDVLLETLAGDLDI